MASQVDRSQRHFKLRCGLCRRFQQEVAPSSHPIPPFISNRGTTERKRGRSGKFPFRNVAARTPRFQAVEAITVFPLNAPRVELCSFSCTKMRLVPFRASLHKRAYSPHTRVEFKQSLWLVRAALKKIPFSGHGWGQVTSLTGGDFLPQILYLPRYVPNKAFSRSLKS